MRFDIQRDYPRPGDVLGRRVVVTGAGGGLGSAVAAAFHASGASVALVGRNRETLVALADAIGGDRDRLLVVAADVRHEDENDRVVTSVVDEWGGLDVWVSNAGVSPVLGGPRETSPASWREVIDVNLTGAFLGARAASAALPLGGRIIVTGSVLGERPRRGLSAYSTSKAGLIGMVKALALDLADREITVNAVNPGWFDSPLTEPWQSNTSLTETVLGHTALGRWGKVEELVGAYLFLASAASSFITGSVITVDGGYVCV